MVEMLIPIDPAMSYFCEQILDRNNVKRSKIDFSSLFQMFQTIVFISWTLDPWKDKTSHGGSIWKRELDIQFIAESKQRRRKGMGTRT